MTRRMISLIMILPMVVGMTGMGTAAATDAGSGTWHYMYVGQDYDCTPEGGPSSALPSGPGLRDGVTNPADVAYALNAPIRLLGTGVQHLWLCGWLTQDALNTPTSPSCSSFGGRDGQGRSYRPGGGYVQFSDLAWDTAVSSNVEGIPVPLQQAVVVAKGRYQVIEPDGSLSDQGQAVIEIWLQFGYGSTANCWDDRGHKYFNATPQAIALISD